MKYQTHSLYTSTSTAWHSIPTSTSTQCSVASCASVSVCFPFPLKPTPTRRKRCHRQKWSSERRRREPKVGSDIRRLEDQTSAAAAVTDVLSLWFTDSYDQTFFSSNKVLSECLCIGSVRTKTRKDSKRSMRLSLEKRGRSVLEN